MNKAKSGFFKIIDIGSTITIYKNIILIPIKNI